MEASGADEAKSRQAAEVVDIALEAVREYFRGLPAAAGTAKSSTPNPVAPLVTIAANMATIACGSTLARIRIVQRDLAIHLAKESRDATKSEADLLRKLSAMHDAVFRACNPKKQVIATETADIAASTGVVTMVDDTPRFQKDWTADDIACLQSCAIPHLNYTKRAESHEIDARTIDREVKKLARISSSKFEMAQAEFECTAFHDPVIKQQNKLFAAYRVARGNIEALNRMYKREVISCIKQCGTRVQITLAREYPETPTHTRLRELFAVFNIPEDAVRPCGKFNLPTFKLLVPQPAD